MSFVKPLETCSNIEKNREDGWEKVWTDIHVQTHPFPHTFFKA